LDAVNTPVLGEGQEAWQARVESREAIGSASSLLPLVSGLPSPAESARALLAKVETIRRLVADDPWEVGRRGAMGDGLSPIASGLGPATPPLVVIGASAGGPAALARVLSGLPGDFPGAVVIVQHVDAQFAAGLGQWLASHGKLPVRLVEEGDVPRAGLVLLAGRDFHLVLSDSGRLGYSRGAAECVYRPSVDLFFKSVALHWRHAAVGVLLTGMGRDGAAGLLALRERGFHTITQDEGSSAVFGMPKAAAELKAAVEVLALDKIAARLVNVLHSKGRMKKAE